MLNLWIGNLTCTGEPCVQRANSKVTGGFSISQWVVTLTLVLFKDQVYSVCLLTDEGIYRKKHANPDVIMFKNTSPMASNTQAMFKFFQLSLNKFLKLGCKQGSHNVSYYVA